MMNLYGGQGMGTTGAGINGGGQMGMQQLMSLLQAGGGGGPAPPSTGTPMAGYIGAPTGAAGMQHPGMAPVQAPQPQTAQQPDMAGLLAMLKAGQGGVSPQGGPNASGASWLANLMAGYKPNGMPGAGVLQGLQGQANGFGQGTQPL